MNVKQPDGWKGTSGSCIVSETHEHSITKPRLAEFSQPYKMVFGENRPCLQVALCLSHFTLSCLLQKWYWTHWECNGLWTILCPCLHIEQPEIAQYIPYPLRKSNIFRASALPGLSTVAQVRHFELRFPVSLALFQYSDELASRILGLGHPLLRPCLQ